MIPATYPVDSSGNMIIGVVAAAGKKAWVDYIPVAQYEVVTNLNLDGADAGTTFTDDGGLSWTASGNAQLDTAQKKFGTASLLCDGTGDYISTVNTTDHDFAALDFTVEGWVRYAVVATPGSRWVSKWTAAGSLQSWRCGYVFSGNTFAFVYSTTGANSVTVSGSFTPVADTWYHFAVSRVGNSLYLFIDGTLIATGDVTGVTIATVSTVTRIGRGDTASDHNGWLDGIQITKGVGRYNASFIVPTAAPQMTTDNNTNQSGLRPCAVISTSGKVAWIDYVPVVNVSTTDARRWRTDDSGALPIRVV